MDVYGHVNNAVYFRYFEVARIHLLARIGFLESFEQDGIGAILHSTNCRFRRPLRYPATARVGTRIVSVDDDRFTQEYVVFDDVGDLMAEGQSIVVSFDYRSGAKAPIPRPIAAAIPEVMVR